MRLGAFFLAYLSGIALRIQATNLSVLCSFTIGAASRPFIYIK